MLEIEPILASAALAAGATARSSGADRARWLRALATTLEENGNELAAIAGEETNLPDVRLRAELARTVFQARLFADRVESGDLLDRRVDLADPEWPMGARPDIRRGYVPIGVVLVFAAGNFPFAFSVVGGDTVSALAAGCPVIVKVHSGHRRLSQRTAELAVAALVAVGAPTGVLATIAGREAGIEAIQDPRVKAAGFTGSPQAGRVLFDLAAARSEPIPFYGELGSTNPVVVTPSGWRERSQDIVEGFQASFALGAGQFCTSPGVVLVPSADAFAARLRIPTVHAMLEPRIADAFEAARTELAGRRGVSTVALGHPSDGSPTASVLSATAEAVLADPAIVSTEMFGPAAVLVEYRDLAEAIAVLETVGGALTATIQGADSADPDAGDLLEVMRGMAGRIVYNEWPTGVTVTDAQQHGGPWPATTASTSTSVGTAAAARFARPIAYQNVPADLLPQELIV